MWEFLGNVDCWKTSISFTFFSLVTVGLADANELKKIDIEVRKEVDAAVQLARSDAELGPDELYTHILYKPG